MMVTKKEVIIEIENKINNYNKCKGQVSSGTSRSKYNALVAELKEILLLVKKMDNTQKSREAKE